jgi:hypothetical protein
MKKLLAFILLLSHMNTSMFLPQAPESDVYDKNGVQLDDITSIVEFVMVRLGIDHHSDDENNDQGQNFHLIKIFDFCYSPVFTKTKNEFFTKAPVFIEYEENNFPTVSFDIIIPPPKAMA